MSTKQEFHTRLLVMAAYLPAQLLKLRVGIPWQVRYSRWCWRREAELERLNRQPEAAARSLSYATAAVPWWRQTGQVPVACCSEAEALERMRTPPTVAAKLMHRASLLPSPAYTGPKVACARCKPCGRYSEVGHFARTLADWPCDCGALDWEEGFSHPPPTAQWASHGRYRLRRGAA